MKKIIAISMLGVTLAITSAFGQGYLQFQSVNSTVWDGFTTAATSKVGSTVDVALFWAPASTASVMPIGSTATTGTNGIAASYTVANAWADILNGTFTLALNASTGNSSVIQLTSSKGGINYLSGSGFGINGTTAGQILTLMAVSWNSAFSTPQAAQTAGSSIGWSAPIQFTTALSSTDLNITSPTFGAFGTFIPGAVPEPTTIALAGLGSLVLLAFRRKK